MPLFGSTIAAVVGVALGVFLRPDYAAPPNKAGGRLDLQAAVVVPTRAAPILDGRSLVVIAAPSPPPGLLAFHPRRHVAAQPAADPPQRLDIDEVTLLDPPAAPTPPDPAAPQAPGQLSAGPDAAPPPEAPEP